MAFHYFSVMQWFRNFNGIPYILGFIQLLFFLFAFNFCSILISWDNFLLFNILLLTRKLQAELERGDHETANSILCIMHESCLSEESTRQYIRNLFEETWNKLNKEIITASDYFQFSKPFVEAAINLAQIAQWAYQHGDGHGSINRILCIIIDPIKW